MNPPHPQRILISRLSAHGDVVQTIALLVLLKSLIPQCRVGWAVEESAAPLLEGHPLIDKLHVSRRKHWLKTLRTKPWKLFEVAREIGTWVQQLRQERYEVGLDVQGLFKSAIVLYLAGIPKRLGYEKTREQADLFYTQKLSYHDLKNPQLPTVVKFCEFVYALGLLSPESPEQTLSRLHFVLPPVADDTQHTVAQWLAPLQPNRPLIAMAPGTIWQSKQWPPEHWKTLARQLATLSVNVLLIGSPKEKPLAQELQTFFAEDQCINLCGKTRLTDLYALFTQVDLLIAPDSAPLHIANAVSNQKDASGKPAIIGLFGATAPMRTGPLKTGAISDNEHRPQHTTLFGDVDCHPCFLRKCPKTGAQHLACLYKLSPQAVCQRILERIEPGTGAASHG